MRRLLNTEKVALVFALIFTLAACQSDDAPKIPTIEVPHISLRLPQEAGWNIDPEATLTDLAKGGTLLRLVRSGSVPGSPRIDVMIEQMQTRPTRLETYLNTNLRQMAALEKQGQIRITDVGQTATTVGQRRAFKVRHEYTLGKGASLISITQISLFVVLDGRGVTVMAQGRTELFHPLAASVSRIMAGVTTTLEQLQKDIDSGKIRTIGDEKNGGTSTIEPIDLDAVGK